MKWSKNKIKKELRIVEKTINRSPTTREAGGILYQACLRYYGSFNKAKLEINLDITNPKYFRLPDSAKVLTPTLAYVIGVILGDGYIGIKPGRKSVILKVKDLDFALKFRSCLKEISERLPSLYKNKSNFHVVTLHSKDLVEFINDFDIKKILNANREIKCSFLRGLYDSDGGLGKSNLDTPQKAKRYIGFYNSDKEIITNTSKLLKELKIRHYIRSRIHSGFGSTKLQYELIISDLESMLRFKKYIDFSIKRKSNNLNLILKSYKRESSINMIRVYFPNNEIFGGDIIGC